VVDRVKSLNIYTTITVYILGDYQRCELYFSNGRGSYLPFLERVNRCQSFCNELCGSIERRSCPFCMCSLFKHETWYHVCYLPFLKWVNPWIFFNNPLTWRLCLPFLEQVNRCRLFLTNHTNMLKWRSICLNTTQCMYFAWTVRGKPRTLWKIFVLSLESERT